MSVKELLERLENHTSSRIAQAVVNSLKAVRTTGSTKAHCQLLEELLERVESEALAELKYFAEGIAYEDAADALSARLGSVLPAIAQAAPTRLRDPRRTAQLRVELKTLIKLIDMLRVARDQAGRPASSTFAHNWARSILVNLPENVALARWQITALSLALYLLKSAVTAAHRPARHTEIEERLGSLRHLMRLIDATQDTDSADDDEDEGKVGVPYENQLLGAFVYALGYESGRRSTTIPVNLFQQTPLDGTFGDLVAGSERCLALEFKREKGTVASEKAKWSEGSLARFLKDPDMIAASRKAHLLCYGRPELGSIHISGMLYVHALGLTLHPKEHPAANIIHGLLALAASPDTTEGMGLPPDSLERYLRKLASIRKKGGGDKRSTWLAAVYIDGGLKIRTAASLSMLLGPGPALGRDLAHRAPGSTQQEVTKRRGLEP